MKLSDFDYSLPESLIAQKPVEPRDSSRLLVLKRASGAMKHLIFNQIHELFNPGDLLVLNDTKVIPARLIGYREDTGGALEVLLLHRKTVDTWEILAKPGRRGIVGREFVFGEGKLRGKIIGTGDSGIKKMKFYYDGAFEAVLDELGEIPLPPYIKRQLDNDNRYQTVYAKNPGSAAAPTAGLHFTGKVFNALEHGGVKKTFVTLHVGLGTFRPVRTDNIEDHRMHSEYYEVGPGAADDINEARESGKHIIAVGTTSVRILESVASPSGYIKPSRGWTDKFIYPGYTFKCTDGLITNFHLPRSTLLMLVSAFAGRENIMKAYREAVDREYRFFSFGDAMIII